MIDPAVERWRKAGRYLPKFMRDFHDQKAIFKAMHRMVDVEKHEYCKEIGWVSGQCYIIDIFLWHMARHGYTLQRAPQKLPFEDIDERTRITNDMADSATAALIFGSSTQPVPAVVAPGEPS